MNNVSETRHIRVQREHPGLTVWFTGLSGAGKSTIATAVSVELLLYGMRVQVLDADWLRQNICRDLGFGRDDRNENIRRISFIAKLLSSHNIVVLVAAISPYRIARDEARASITDFVEVHVNAPLAICEKRDPKGLYKRARRGEITSFTGIDDPYEAPLLAEVCLNTDEESLQACVDKVLQSILERLSTNS
jgi:adenylyl-sulfate kinase